jgi:hypothetical protein
MLLGAKVYPAFGQSELQNRRASPRPACTRLRARVPAGETLWIAGLPPISAAFYLDGLPVESLVRDPARLAATDRLHVAVEARDLGAFTVPQGFRSREVAREPIPGSELVLLRLDRDGPPR